MSQMKPHLPYVSFEVTHACNLACRYCYNIWHLPTARPVGAPRTTGAPYERTRRTLGQLFRTARVDYISLTGGEPFLMPRLEEIVLFCRLKGASVTLISNGNAADCDRYRQMIELGVSPFQFPLLSADARVHDALTARPGSWEL